MEQRERTQGCLRSRNEIDRLTSDEIEGGKLRAVHALQTAIVRWLARAVPAAIAALMYASAALNAAPLRIVAIGASNTHGWYVGNQVAIPCST